MSKQSTDVYIYPKITIGVLFCSNFILIKLVKGKVGKGIGENAFFLNDYKFCFQNAMEEILK